LIFGNELKQGYIKIKKLFIDRKHHQAENQSQKDWFSIFNEWIIWYNFITEGEP